MPSSRNVIPTGPPTPGTSDPVRRLDSPDLVLRFWKPYDCLTAFTDREGRQTIADHVDVAGVYPAGRLDRDSEGLLILTRSKRLRGALTDATIGHPRTYLVQVEGVPDPAALARLADGVPLRDGITRPARAELLADPPPLPPRPVPIRVRKSIPDSWLRVTLTEGRNRQLRRMTAAVGHPTLRLVRVGVGPVGLDGLRPGEWRVLDESDQEALQASLRQARAASRQDPDRRRRGPRSSR